MKPAFWARRAHKWIALVIGVQALLWMASGLYMTFISIDIIHGDHLAHDSSGTLSASARRLDHDALMSRYPDMAGFRLKRLLGREVYEVTDRGGTVLVDAFTGEQLSPIGEAMARKIASSMYQGEAGIASAELITEAPQEVATRPVPMWRIEFADDSETTLYLSPHTGDLLARRHDLWRWFDFLWMLHIMDYDERSDVNNMLLRIAASIGTLFAMSGLWLLLYSFSRRKPA